MDLLLSLRHLVLTIPRYILIVPIANAVEISADEWLSRADPRTVGETSY